MTHLSVNLNAVAMLRNRRSVPWPSVTGIARVALDAGADGITVHPRPDERHIRRTDVFELVAMLRRDYPGREFNIEGYPSEDFLALCEAARPDQVTLVPDDPLQSTSDHGWPIEANRALLLPAIERLHAGGMRVSLFIDADPTAPAAAALVGADRVELYTGPYGAALQPEPATARLAALKQTADAARLAGANRRGPARPLQVNAGHDLNLVNLPPLKAAIPDLAEVSIGHAVTADALLYGMAETVRRYKAACS
ncbi:MAG: pyridoxine 5'-phosphate synthase [Devosia sp.]|nr:pyridoxine 5'-phosphate synthase [Devosia sp.]